MGFHWYELVILAVIGLLVFGPKRLPEIGSSVGKTIREFQKSMREVTNPDSTSSLPPSAAQSAQPIAAASTPTPEPIAATAAPAVESEPTIAAEATAPVQEDAVR